MTSPGQPVMTTFVEIRPKTDGFVPEAEAQLVPASQALGRKMGQAVGQGTAAGQQTARSELKQTEQALVATGNAADQVGRKIGHAKALLGGLITFEVTRKLAEGARTAVDYASDLDTTLARSRRVFGESSERVDKFAEGAARSLGLSRGAADATATSFGNLATQMGLSHDKAAEVSENLTKISAELSASKGGTIAETEAAIQTALTGRGVALRRYGIVLDNASLKEEAYKLKLISSTKDGLSPATKYLASYSLIMQKTAGVQGYFAAHTDLLSEKLAISKAESYNASEALGKAMIPAESALASFTSNELNPALEALGKVIGAIGDHRVSRDAVEALGAIAGGLYLTSKAIKTYESIKNASIFRKTEEVAARRATTAAITAEGRAAAVAAGEVEALNVAERGGGAGAGVTAAERAAAAGTRFGTAVGAGVVGLARTSIIGGAALGIYGLTTEGLTRGDQQRALREGALARGRSVAIGGFDGRSFAEDLTHRLGSKTLDRLTGYDADKAAADAATQAAARRLLAQHAAGHYDAPGGIVLTPGRQDAFNRAGVATANKQAADKVLAAARGQFADPKYRDAQASALGGAFGGAFDVLPDTTVGDPTKASAAAATATDRVRAAEERLRLAQLRLVDTRKRRHVTVSALASATSSVASAQRAVQTAEGKQTAADKAAADAGASTALSATDLLKRLTGNVGHAVQLRDASKKLVAEGISGPVLEELDKLEKSAPGTLVRVAAGATPALIKAMNAQKTALDKVESEFTNAPSIAVLKGLKAADDVLTRNATAAGKKAGQAYAAGVVDGLGPVAPLFLPGGISGGVKQPAAPSSSTPGGYTPVQPATPSRPSQGDPRGDGAQHGTPPVHLHVHGYGARQVRHVAATEIGRHDNATGRLVAGVM